MRREETRSPVPMKSGQGHVPVLRTVDLANQRLRSAEHFLVQNDVVLVRQISAVDLRDQRFGTLRQAPVRISLGQGILGQKRSTVSKNSTLEDGGMRRDHMSPALVQSRMTWKVSSTDSGQCGQRGLSVMFLEKILFLVANLLWAVNHIKCKTRGFAGIFQSQLQSSKGAMLSPLMQLT
ncbi:hypothetical protein RHMOL_Rhmol03G0287300 [Rhododendron molle]|uniref:Uncharacterized protein n=1 Tax=Rhododendron molle TaxID=49168 RepID=A0ACC0PKU4_RHOML|nr:hypothetical protein RHMOL_Rhmol03G0287300 [Rhododendron molle]